MKFSCFFIILISIFFVEERGIARACGCENDVIMGGSCGKSSQFFSVLSETQISSSSSQGPDPSSSFSSSSRRRLLDLRHVFLLLLEGSELHLAIGDLISELLDFLELVQVNSRDGFQLSR